MSPIIKSRDAVSNLIPLNELSAAFTVFTLCLKTENNKRRKQIVRNNLQSYIRVIL